MNSNLFVSISKWKRFESRGNNIAHTVLDVAIKVYDITMDLKLMLKKCRNLVYDVIPCVMF